MKYFFTSHLQARTFFFQCKMGRELISNCLERSNGDSYSKTQQRLHVQKVIDPTV
jgi:hypothetical protein